MIKFRLFPYMYLLIWTLFIETHPLFQFDFNIMMREHASGYYYSKIDNFDITIPFSSGNEEEVLTGDEGVASITLKYTINCIEPDACTTSVTASDLIGTCIF